jgi:hypothetical protein
MRKSRIVVAVIIAGMLAIIIIYELHLVTMLREENCGLRAQLTQAEELRLQTEQISRPKDGFPRPTSEQEKVELLCLRGQVGLLRRQLAEAETGKAAPNPTATPKQEDWTDWAETPEGRKALASMAYGKALALSLIRFADQNRGQYPTNLDSAVTFMPDSAKAQTNFVMDQFELLYHGVDREITNGISVIVIREKEPWVTPRGQWAKTYAFADGHSQVHIESTKDALEGWEAEHRPIGAAR